MTQADIILVAAVADNGVIGAAGTMPWHAPEDLRHFRRFTMGYAVIMGRPTFAATGKALPGRHNIVLTRNRQWQAPDVTAVGSFAEAIAAARADGDAKAPIMVIGGAEIFTLAMPYATQAEITRLHISPEGDCFWPELDARQWRKMAETVHPDAVPAMTIESWRRIDGAKDI